MSPLVRTWISDLTTRFHVTLTEAWESESWEPYSSIMEMSGGEGESHGAVVLSLVTLFMSMIEAFFDHFKSMAEAAAFPVSIRPEWVSDMEDKILKSFSTFLNNLLKLFTAERAWHELMPPPPTYAAISSDDGVEQFFEQFKRMGRGIEKGLADKGLGKKRTPFDEAVVAVAADAARSARRMCVQVASVLYCKEKLKALTAAFQRGWDGVVARVASFEGRTAPPPPQLALHENGAIVADAFLERMYTFFGAKLVFEDLRRPLFDDLYSQPSRESLAAEMGPTLGTGEPPLVRRLLDGVLFTVQQLTPSRPVRDELVWSVLTATVEALMRVVLDGEPSRSFTADDAEKLAADVKLLQDYVVARQGEVVYGLPAEVAGRGTRPLHEVVALMRQPTGELRSELRRALDGLEGAPDKHIAWRVVLHRQDGEPIVTEHRAELRDLLRRSPGQFVHGKRKEES